MNNLSLVYTLNTGGWSVMCYFVPVIVLTSNDSYMYIYVGKDLIFTVVFQ